jgi:hypothetical protein
MKRLGYDKFGAQGGDWGTAVTQAMSEAGAGAGDAFAALTKCSLPSKEIHLLSGVLMTVEGLVPEIDGGCGVRRADLQTAALAKVTPWS